LANLVWGRLVTKKVGQAEETQWQYVSDQLTEIRPTLEDQTEVLSFKEYIDRLFPVKSAQEIPDANERGKANQEIE